MRKTPLPSGISPDTRAVVSVAQELTMQVRRIANALTTPAAVIRDGLLTALDGSATTCSAQYTGVLPVGECIRAAGHTADTDHTDDRGRNWGDSLAEYPLADSTVRVAHWHPASELLAEERQELAGMVDQFVDAQVQHARANAPGPDFTSPLTGIEVRRPCPYCGDHQMIPTHQYAEHVARLHPDERTVGPDIPVPDAEAPAADEDAQRTTRRNSLRHLTARASSSRLTHEDAALLREGIDAEIREHDTMRAVAAGNKRHVQVMYAELEQTRVDLQAQAELRADVQRDRDQHAAVLREVLATFVHKVPGYRLPRVRSGEVDVVTLGKWRSVVAPTVERPWWETVTELRAELEQLRALAPMLDGLHNLIATSSRDWEPYRVDAWLWAVLCGWDCEQDEHDETCTHGALEETAAMHGWDDDTVAKARRYRAAVRAVVGLDESRQALVQVAHPETNPQASGSPTVDEQPGHGRPDAQQASTEVQL